MRRFANCIFTLIFTALLITTWGCKKSAQARSAGPGVSTTLDRTVLPTAEPTFPPITDLDARNAEAPPIFEVKAPQGAPNVIVILLDNFGDAVEPRYKLGDIRGATTWNLT